LFLFVELSIKGFDINISRYFLLFDQRFLGNYYLYLILYITAYVTAPIVGGIEGVLPEASNLDNIYYPPVASVTIAYPNDAFKVF
jgi:hypothetical protein